MSDPEILTGTLRRPVMVIDDDPEIREAIGDVLGAEGYETVQCADGGAALQYLRTHPAPCLILLDWNMAPMNGALFLAQLHRDPTFDAIPVVLVTADMNIEDKAAGLVGYLRKPVDIDALLATVASYCSAT